jgi:hypothetical protein
LLTWIKASEHITLADPIAVVGVQFNQCCTNLEPDPRKDTGFNRAKTKHPNWDIVLDRSSLNRNGAVCVEEIGCHGQGDDAGGH